MNTESRQLLASSPRGLADLLARELAAFGAENIKERSTGVAFSGGGLRAAYRACLESRLANRIFLELGRFEVVDAAGFYAAAREIDWSAHLAPGATLACDFSGRHPAITHTHFGALKLKDAIVDSIREATGARPDVSLERPGVRVHAHANGNAITVSLDLSGESLHRRGYRGAAGEAPLKENVAAGMLMRSGWVEMAASAAAAALGTPQGTAVGMEFLDPMCGSGTLVIEAALIAAEIAPGLGRDYYGFLGWRGHDAQVWREVLEEANMRAREGAARLERMRSRVEETPSRLEGAPSRLVMRGFDRDGAMIRIARANAERAGVGRLVEFEVRALADAAPARAVGTDAMRVAAGDSGGGVATDVARAAGADAGDDATAGAGPGAMRAAGVDAGGGVATDVARAAGADAGGGVATDVARAATAGTVVPRGLLCVNPPYGVRLDDHDGALATHRELGKVLRERFQGWIAGVLIGSPELGMELGIRAYRTHTLWNGAIECRLLRLKVDAESEREPGRFGKTDATLKDSPGARMFANRLSKNLKNLRSWSKRDDVSCYRVYDADMPEYAFAIDIYRTMDPELTWLYVQEYAAPSEIELDAVRRRRNEALSVLPEVTGVPEERIHVRTRRRNKRGEQYRKVDEQANFHVVTEGGLKFRVNFDDYLDTGLFLDHRMTRARLREASSGKRFLNLFAYTGTGTVYAAAGGASATTTVDMSRTYLDWAERNLAINGLAGRQHAFVQADCLTWLQEAADGRQPDNAWRSDSARSPDNARDHARPNGRYDLIFLDPPTFSNSKRMEGVLDVERDHGALIDSCVKLLATGGLLVFSTNAQRFKLEESLLTRYDIRDISAATLPKDFERNPRIHRCFEIRDSKPTRSLYRGPAVR